MSTRKPSRSFEKEIKKSFTERIEEAELLWKLGRKREALGQIGSLLKDNPEDLHVLETAAYFYLAAGKIRKAQGMIRRLEKMEGQSLFVLELKGELASRKKRWSEAGLVYQTIFEKDPENKRLRRPYAETLAHLRRWTEARQIYRDLLLEKEGKNLTSLRWDYQRWIEQGAPNAGGKFEYFHHPGEERNYVVNEHTSIWISPWLRMGAAMTQEIHKKGGRDEASAVDRFLYTHSVESQFYYEENTNVLTRWKTSYYDADSFHELDIASEFERRPLHSWAGYEWNRVARDPIEALAKHGKVDRLWARNVLTFFERLEAGHEIHWDWYRLRGSTNNINAGADHLGYKLDNDFFVNLMLWDKPYVSVNYHFRRGKWNQKFLRADEVIGFLPSEQAHQGGLFLEHNLGPHLSVNLSLTRGSDRKRHVDFLYWVYGAEYWVSERLKLTFSYEYDYGDSGTAGSGNSQIFTGGVDWYF